jgi:hypothetical protein
MRMTAANAVDGIDRVDIRGGAEHPSSDTRTMQCDSTHTASRRMTSDVQFDDALHASLFPRCVISL